MKIDLIDVFGSSPMTGNPLAVVHGGCDLSDHQMLRLTQWLGFSETTFLLPPEHPEADYKVRIFYPAGELPFAGHPTLGTCHAWLAAGGTPRDGNVIVQECGVGLVRVRRDQGLLAFAAPPLIRSGPLNEEELSNALAVTGADPQSVVEAVHVVNGPLWQMLRLKSAADVLAATPASKAPPGTDIGLAGPCEEVAEHDWELRAFFANQHGQIVEDPVTGSFNAGVARHLIESGIEAGDFVAAQGRCTGADGKVLINRDADGTIWIGGYCHTVSRAGEVAL
ncbi:MAG: PhzF family phenazine biosynthesis protein [Pseudomonadota bacterium]|nr:PhzF family phenazine biosynthesis protein [Pseudomonadota bacterium]